MDIGTLIMGLGMLLLCILPFAFMIARTNRRKKQLLQNLRQKCLPEDADLSMADIWGQSAITLSTDGQKVLAIRTHADGEQAYTIDLHGMRTCTIEKRQRTLSEKGHNNAVIDGLILKFIPAQQHLPVQTIPIYDAGTDGFTIQQEVQIAEKWVRKLNDAITAIDNTA